MIPRESWVGSGSDGKVSGTFSLDDGRSIPDAGGSAVISGSEDGASSSPEGHSDSTKKRKRASSVSCQLCQQRKVKCDRVLPSCGWCSRNEKICEYREKMKPGIRTGYGRELETKINRLEAMLQLQGRRLEEHIARHADSTYGSEPPRLAHHSPNVSHSDISQHQGPPHSAPTAPNPRSQIDINAYAGPSRISAEAVPHGPITLENGPMSAHSTDRTHYFQAVDTMSVQAMIDVNQARNRSLSTSRINQSNLPTMLPDLPPYEVLYSLVDLYFKHVNTWSPILDSKTTFTTLKDLAHLDEADRILLHAITATTLRFSRDQRLTGAAKTHYYNTSKQKVQLYGLEHPNVKSLQALVILALDVLGSSNSMPGQNMLALISRTIVQLDLGVEKSVYLTPASPLGVGLKTFALSQPQSWTEDEERRRLFWMAYCLDRYSTVESGLDFVLDEREMDRTLPCRYDLFSKNEPVETRWFRWPEASETKVDNAENLGSFAYHCEVLRILSRIHRFLKRPVDIRNAADVEQWQITYRELDHELNIWLQRLPGDFSNTSQLCHSDPSSKVSNWIMLQASFDTSVIRLHSAAAYPTIRSHLFTPSYSAMHRCLSAAESLREIAQDVINTGMLDLLGPPFAFALWVSARLLLVHASTMDYELDPNIGFFISTLEQMGQYWEVAHVYAQKLRSVLREYQQTKNSVRRAHPTTSTRKSFASMRRCAYDLRSQMSKNRRSVLEPTYIKALPANELDYLDIFDFFNYPRLLDTTASGPQMAEPGMEQQDLGIEEHFMPDFAMPNPESDWLIYNTPND